MENIVKTCLLLTNSRWQSLHDARLFMQSYIIRTHLDHYNIHLPFLLFWINIIAMTIAMIRNTTTITMATMVVVLTPLGSAKKIKKFNFFYIDVNRQTFLHKKLHYINKVLPHAVGRNSCHKPSFLAILILGLLIGKVQC